MKGSAFGHIVETDLALKRLGPVIEPALGRLEIVHGDLEGCVPTTFDRPPGAEAGALVGKRNHDDTVTIWERGVAKFHLDPARHRIVVGNHERDDEWENQLLNTAVSLLLTSLDHFVLHGAAVLTEHGVVIFIGPSGRGKSSVAAAAASMDRVVLADDGVLLTNEVGTGGGFAAWRGPRHIRLVGTAPGSVVRERKHTRHLSETQQSVASGPVASIVMLAPRTDSMSPIRPLEARFRVAGLLANSFSVDEQTRRGQLSIAAAVADRVPVCQVSLPDDLEQLAAAVELVLARMADAHGSGTPDISVPAMPITAP